MTIVQMMACILECSVILTLVVNSVVLGYIVHRWLSIKKQLSHGEVEWMFNQLSVTQGLARYVYCIDHT